MTHSAAPESLGAGALYVANDSFRADSLAILQTPRIGVAHTGEWAVRPWRFCLDSRLSLQAAAEEPRIALPGRIHGCGLAGRQRRQRAHLDPHPVGAKQCPAPGTA